MKFLEKINTKANNAVVEKENSSNSIVKGYYALLAVFGVLAMATAPTFALTNIFNKVSSSLKNIYTQIMTISAVVAITFIAICLIIRMVSKNQRSVEEATAWIKRIVITWLILNLLSFFLAYGRELTSGGTVTNWN